MGVEFELKYKCTHSVREKIYAAHPGPWQTIAMETVYYDTPEGALSEKYFTLRRRMENGVSVCTIKTPLSGAGRGEWEVQAGSIEEAIPMLCKLGCPAELEQLCAGGVKAVCGAKFTRLASMVEENGTVMELALDEGVLFADDVQMPLCEVEVELKAGTQAHATAYATLLAHLYGLAPENASKFRRALALRKEHCHGTTE